MFSLDFFYIKIIVTGLRNVAGYFFFFLKKAKCAHLLHFGSQSSGEKKTFPKSVKLTMTVPVLTF